MSGEGYFDGTITGVEIGEDGYEKDGLVLCFEIRLQDGDTVVAKHSTLGKYSEITEGVVRSLDLPWPHGIEDLESRIGRSVRVRSKLTPKGHMRHYIAVPLSTKPATKAAVAAAVAKMTEQKPLSDDDIPF